MSQCGRKESLAGCDTPGSKCGFVKSSAFAPVSLNLMGMYLVKEHMNAHYRRLYSVKAAVDTKAPHSLQAKHQAKSVGGTRSTSRSSSRLGFAKDSVMHAVLRENPEYSMKISDKISRYLESVQKDQPNVCIPGMKEKSARPASSTGHLSSSYHSRRIHPGSDLMEKHKDYFTKPTESFFPRTLIRDGKSRLIDSRVYHPPVHRSSSYGSVNQQTLRTEHAFKTRTRQMALASGRANRMVPALNIQRDRDHVRWLEEKARKIKTEEMLDALDCITSCNESDEFEELDHRRHFPEQDHLLVRPERTSKSKRTSTSIKTIASMGDQLNDNSHIDPGRQQTNFSEYENSNFLWMKKQLEMKEEELKYLEFIRDVTNDILTYGIHADRGLQQLFFYHMNVRRDLNSNKMKKLLEKLQEELGISKSDSYTWLDMAEANSEEFLPSSDKQFGSDWGIRQRGFVSDEQRMSRFSGDSPKQPAQSQINDVLNKGKGKTVLFSDSITSFPSNENFYSDVGDLKRETPKDFLDEDLRHASRDKKKATMFTDAENLNNHDLEVKTSELINDDDENIIFSEAEKDLHDQSALTNHADKFDRPNGSPESDNIDDASDYVGEGTIELQENDRDGSSSAQSSSKENAESERESLLAAGSYTDEESSLGESYKLVERIGESNSKNNVKDRDDDIERNSVDENSNSVSQVKNPQTDSDTESHISEEIQEAYFDDFEASEIEDDF